MDKPVRLAVVIVYGLKETARSGQLRVEREAQPVRFGPWPRDEAEDFAQRFAEDHPGTTAMVDPMEHNSVAV